MSNVSPANWHPKVQASGTTGAATVVLIWAVSLAGLDVPPEVASAVTTILATLAGWFTPTTVADDQL